MSLFFAFFALPISSKASHMIFHSSADFTFSFGIPHALISHPKPHQTRPHNEQRH